MFDIGLVVKRIYNRIYCRIYRKQFGKCGSNVEFSPFDSKLSYKNIFLGDNIYIGYNADMIATKSNIIVGNHVVFGPHVSIRGGDHRTDIAGRFIDSVDDDMKLPENDQDVVFEGDNWIGMNATILKGCTIGKGSIVAAGSVVNKSTPPL